MLSQVADPTNHTLMDAVVGGILVLTQLGTVWLGHLKGKKGNVTMDGRLTSLGNNLKQIIETRCDTLSDEVTGVRRDISTLSAHVIGPDGQNGLRGEVRQLKVELAQLAPRKLAAGRKR